MRTGVALAILACALVNVASSYAGVVQNIYGPTNIAIIAKPDSVRAWRSVGSLRDSGHPEDYYEKSGNGVAVSEKRAKELSKLLLRDDSYPPLPVPGGPPSAEKNCSPLPGVIVTFFKGNQSVNLFFCFDCDILQVNIDWKNPHRIPRPSITDFDPSASKLARVMKNIFPNDPQIQALTKNN
jgi:hypothetical protein